jgi:hypothetical protein
VGGARPARAASVDDRSASTSDLAVGARQGTSPLSIAARRSCRFPISGSGFSSGTARCMFEPIQRAVGVVVPEKGISAVATDQICVGETSIRSTCFGEAVTTSPSRERQSTWPLSLCVLGSTSALACAITLSSSCVASSQTTLSVTTPSSTTW